MLEDIMFSLYVFHQNISCIVSIIFTSTNDNVYIDIRDFYTFRKAVRYKRIYFVKTKPYKEKINTNYKNIIYKEQKNQLKRKVSSKLKEKKCIKGNLCLNILVATDTFLPLVSYF